MRPNKVSIIVALVLMGLLTVMFFGAFAHYQYVEEVKAKEEALSAAMESQLETMAVTLAPPMWDFNTRQIRVIAQAALKHPNITGLSVFNAQRQPVVQLEGENPGGDSFTQERAIVYAHDGKQETIGSITLQVSRQELQENALTHAMDLVKAAAVFLLLELLLLFVILRYLL